MKYFVACYLIKLKPATKAVSNEHVGIQGSNFGREPAAHFDGANMKISLKPHNAAHAATIKRAFNSFNVVLWN